MSKCFRRVLVEKNIDSNEIRILLDVTDEIAKKGFIMNTNLKEFDVLEREAAGIDYLDRELNKRIDSLKRIYSAETNYDRDLTKTLPLSLEEHLFSNIFSQFQKNSAATKKYVDVFFLGTYLKNTAFYIRKYLRNNGFLDAENFSFNVAKFQKLLILVLLKYSLLLQNKHVHLVDSQENEVFLLRMNCGFALDYGCSIFELDLFPNSNSKDLNLSLRNLFEKRKNGSLEELKQFIFDLENKTLGLDNLAFVSLEDKLKEATINVLFDYLLFEPKRVGEVLDATKSEEINTKFSIQDLLNKGKEIAV